MRDDVRIRTPNPHFLTGNINCALKTQLTASLSHPPPHTHFDLPLSMVPVLTAPRTAHTRFLFKWYLVRRNSEGEQRTGYAVHASAEMEKRTAALSLRGRYVNESVLAFPLPLPHTQTHTHFVF